MPNEYQQHVNSKALLMSTHNMLKTYVGGTNWKGASNEYPQHMLLLMSIHNICFYDEEKPYQNYHQILLLHKSSAVIFNLQFEQVCGPISQSVMC